MPPLLSQPNQKELEAQPVEPEGEHKWLEEESKESEGESQEQEEEPRKQEEMWRRNQRTLGGGKEAPEKREKHKRQNKRRRHCHLFPGESRKKTRTRRTPKALRSWLH